MSNSELVIRRVAVLGAGVMGAQIAAHLVNANIPTLLYDLPASEGDPNSLINKAVAGLKKLKPSPLAVADKASYLEVANYNDDLAKLTDCDLVIEAIAERLDWKLELYNKITPHLAANSIVVSNTSGLSITKLADVLPAELRERFFGVHFFNPPRYMRLVELIPHAGTSCTLMQSLETFLVTTLGKGVVYAKDTPNFIANRVGVFAYLATLHHAKELNIPFDVVDGLTGKLIGRPKSATLRTMDVVGLDTFAHVIQTMADNLPDDPWLAYYKTPDWMTSLIEQGALGQKAGCGVYKKEGKTINVLDLATQSYQPATNQPDADVVAILKVKDPVERMQKLAASEHPQARFLWRSYRDIFHYCAYHLADIANNVRDVDLAVRWGFGWSQGPFEIWQAAGWATIREQLGAAVASGESLAQAELPNWVNDRDAVYSAAGAFDPHSNSEQARSDLAVYQRQLYPDAVLGEVFNEGETIFETDAVRLWHTGDDIAILSFKTKMNTATMGVIAGIQEAVAHAEKDYKALVVWQRHGDHFGAGANLQEFAADAAAGRYDALYDAVHQFQKATMRLRYSNIPTVAAVKGLALGGCCEIMLHCDRVVAALESYIGLVEIGVGLLPAGGGTKEFALRAAQSAFGDDIFTDLQKYYQYLAMAETSGSGLEAQAKHFLRQSDVVIFHPDELLYVAKQQARCLAESGYRPPLPAKFAVAGKAGIANLQLMLVNYREGGFISDYDYELGTTIAKVICGGEVEKGSIVDEEWVLRLEREYFVELTKQQKTQERIEHMLKTGKPLRN